MEALLDIRHLSTHFATSAGVVRAVDDVSLSVMPGEVVGLVGESGSGKSMLGLSILGLVDAPGRITGGDIVFRGRPLTGQSESTLRAVRGKDLAMVFQDPSMALNPVLSIETQMVETLRAHAPLSRKDARARAVKALERVGIPDAATRIRSYPHEFSGGMRQRVAIAMAILNRPALIICDEATTALDVTIQGQVIRLFQTLCREDGTALVWISHDLAAVASIADRILTMYAGRIVESGPAQTVLAAAHHPYTAGLIRSVPSQTPRGERLYQIPGHTPDLAALPGGCPFRTRCPRASERCSELPPWREADAGHGFLCWHPEHLA
ncbi:MAG: ABC transporter ATP-binding protein [Rhodocyclaceae bacterium]